jgi:hypothetical protein
MNLFENLDCKTSLTFKRPFARKTSWTSNYLLSPNKSPLPLGSLSTLILDFGTNLKYHQRCSTRSAFGYSLSLETLVTARSELYLSGSP